MILLPPRSTRTDTLFPYTTLFRSRKADIGFPASSPEQRPPDRRVQRSRLPFRLERILSWIAGKANGVTAPEVPRGRFSGGTVRSEEHTSELQSLMRISYAVFCLKNKKKSRKE